MKSLHYGARRIPRCHSLLDAIRIQWSTYDRGPPNDSPGAPLRLVPWLNRGQEEHRWAPVRQDAEDTPPQHSRVLEARGVSRPFFLTLIARKATPAGRPAERGCIRGCFEATMAKDRCRRRDTDLMKLMMSDFDVLIPDEAKRHDFFVKFRGPPESA